MCLKFVNANGNNVYIDDIRLSETTSADVIGGRIFIRSDLPGGVIDVDHLNVDSNAAVELIGAKSRIILEHTGAGS